MFLYKHFLSTPDEANTDETEDILRNLGYILSSKRGCSHFRPLFGLSDVAFRTPEEAVTQISQEVLENVRLYEPRVRLIRVDEQYDDDGRRASLIVVLRPWSDEPDIHLRVDLQNGSVGLNRAPETAHGG